MTLAQIQEQGERLFMPELTYPPHNPVWPPPNSIDPRVTPYRVAHKGNYGESFLDICSRFGIKFEDLIQFNFGLKRTEPKYMEKINWYLKNKLGCRKTTANGNFILSGGETIYIPQLGVVMDPVGVVGTATEGRLTRYVYHEQSIVEPRDPEAPNPFVMMVSDAIKNWMIEKSTGHAPSPPNRWVTQQSYNDIPTDQVLTALNILRTRNDIKPSQWVRLGSYNVTMEFNFVYGPSAADKKIQVTQTTIWTQANGEITRNVDYRFIDQPTNITDLIP
jgi:hypothetical protein